ncbi:MAG: ABC transporter transmembrane domain-containing protein, partial [Anaerolineales bacterium]
METLRFLYPLARAYRGRYLLGILLTPASTWLALAIPGLTGRAVERLRELAGRPEASLDGVVALAGAIVGLALGRGLLLFAVRMLVIGASRGFEYDLRNDFFAHLERLPMSFFQQNRTGDL